MSSSQQSSTQSVRTISLAEDARGKTGLLPQVISNMNTPKANTSELVLAFPVLESSGEIYPNVPATLEVCGSIPCSQSLARPKSPSFAFIDSSRRMFAGLMSL
ncbi:hypothetical protein BRARA_H01456 [Brassica rapa]|uniref:Uncharacterized protein n=1 Tax=Brassica campestris TaxID=3711 RepID=A0A397YBA8_BRACM|nr:hypothetical protein BRARA_H01456 [Brassica rapa]